MASTPRGCRAPADEFRERSAELRLAWAAAADWPPTINLLRARSQRSSRTWLARAAVVAGTAAGLGGGWWAAERTLRSAPPAGTASTGPARGRGPAPVRSAAARATPLPAAVNKAPAVTPPAVVVNRPPVVVPPPEAAVPFDAMLGTILYSPDRKLAIIDNQIVGVGDEVRGARVTEITAAAVLLRDAQGKLRRLTPGAGGR